LVTVVAMAAHGAAWNEHRGGDVRSLPHGVIVAATISALVLGGLLFLLLLVGARARETPDQRERRRRNAIALLIFLAAIVLAHFFVHPKSETTRRPAAPPGGTTAPRAAGGRTHGTNATTWWPLVIVGLCTAGAFVAATARRAGAGAPPDAATAAAVAMVDASLDDLRTEPDPRLAVIAAYARMERGLAARGFARQPAETPTEYFHRALTAEEGVVVAVSIEPLRELTSLAERARFSTRPIDESMRSLAIAALESLRDELRRESLTGAAATGAISAGRPAPRTRTRP
jgi:Domain of unknown function (DUF4129)